VKVFVAVHGDCPVGEGQKITKEIIMKELSDKSIKDIMKLLKVRRNSYWNKGLCENLRVITTNGTCR
jgi:hypothetical protein